MSQERKRVPFLFRPRWAIGFVCLFGLLATAWGADSGPVGTISETANGPIITTGRTSEASRVSDSARGPRLDPISEIRFAGNDTTKPRIMLQEMLVRVGDPADPALIERSRQAIMDLELFKSVRADLQPAPAGPVLLITVDEKYYILPIPKLNRSDDGVGYGGQLRLDNIAGLNQQLKLTYEQEKTHVSSSGQQEVFSLLYVYPRMFGGPYRLEVEGGVERLPLDVLTGETVTAGYEQTTSFASFKLTRWLDLKGPSQGWQVGGGMVWRQQAFRYLSGTSGLYQDASGVGAIGLVEYSMVHDYLYSRSGVDYGLNAEFGISAFGCDINYSSEVLFYRNYLPVFDRPHHNLDLQLQLGLSSNHLFDGDVYSLGGGKSLRGYESGSITGNAFVQANAEYLAPLFGYYPLRGVVFIDAGNAFPDNHDIRLSDLKWSAGLGLRLKVKSFVRIDLRVDAAYAFDTRETKIYGGTKATF